MKLKPRLIVLLGLALLLSAHLALAKGVWNKVTISGEGLPGVIEITDEAVLQSFWMYIFQDLTQPPINPPQVVGSGYELRRGWVENDVFTPFDMVRYYADPEGDEGYLYYVGLVNADGEADGSSEYDGNWYRVTAVGEAAMQEVFSDYDIQPLNADQTPALALNSHICLWSAEPAQLERR